jgi:hypothetical protein
LAKKILQKIIFEYYFFDLIFTKNRKKGEIPITDFSSIADKHTLVTQFLFLCGAESEAIQANDIVLDEEAWELLHQNKAARIVRALTALRNHLIQNWTVAYENINLQKKTLWSSTPTISEILKQLQGVNGPLLKKQGALLGYLSTINTEIGNRINNCKTAVSPEYWEIIKSAVLMPNGSVANSIEREAKPFINGNCPVGVYANIPQKKIVAAMKNDRAFMIRLSGDDDQVEDSIQTAAVRSSLNTFISQNTRTVIIVDCENADPYKLCAAINQIEPGLRKKIAKIILVDDAKSSIAWGIFKNYVGTGITIEHEVVDRMLTGKSLVDLRISARVNEEFYRNNVPAFVISSSDSDMWGFVSVMPNTKFLFLLEKSKCAYNLIPSINAQRSTDYCLMDNVMSTSSVAMWVNSVVNACKDSLPQIPQSIDNIAKLTLHKARIQLTPDEFAKLCEIIGDSLTISFDENQLRLAVEKGKLTAQLLRLYRGA